MSNQPTEKKETADVAGPSTSTPVEKKEEKKKLPQLGALEDDDEFEVSISAGCLLDQLLMSHAGLSSIGCVDWEPLIYDITFQIV